MKTLLSIALCTLAFACGDDNKTSTDAGVTPTANGVFPASGFSGATMRVEISGDATSFASGATVDFGSGVTVSNVAIASPTDLFCDLAIDASAPTGLHDVTITSNGTFKLSQAFEIDSPVAAAFVGDLVQGTVVSFVIQNRNFNAPFDTSNTPQLTGPDGVNFSVSANDEFSISGFAFIDVTAGSGPITVTAGETIASTDPITIATRTATPITASMTTGTIAASGDTGLYTITSAAGDLVHFAASSTDANAAPFVALLPASGSWLDELPADYTIGSGTYYAIVADNGTEGNYSYTLSGTAETLTVAAEGNDTTDGVKATAPAASALPYELTPAAMSSATDVDIIKLTVDAGHANLHAHVVTAAGSDALTDTAVELQDAAGSDYLSDGNGGAVVDNNSDCSLFGCSNLGEDVASSPLPAGTYYLYITPGASYATADKSYSALIWLE